MWLTISRFHNEVVSSPSSCFLQPGASSQFIWEWVLGYAKRVKNRWSGKRPVALVVQDGIGFEFLLRWTLWINGHKADLGAWVTFNFTSTDLCAFRCGCRPWPTTLPAVGWCGLCCGHCWGLHSSSWKCKTRMKSRNVRVGVTFCAWNLCFTCFSLVVCGGAASDAYEILLQVSFSLVKRHLSECSTFFECMRFFVNRTFCIWILNVCLT